MTIDLTEEKIDVLAQAMMDRMICFTHLYTPIQDRNFNDNEAAEFLRVSVRELRYKMIGKAGFPAPFLLPHGTREADRRRWRAVDIIAYRDALIENKV